MSVAGRKSLILLGVAFVLLAVGITVGVRVQSHGKQRKARLRARDRDVEHLVEIRTIARQVADDHRVVAAWSHPSPHRLWAIAVRRRRVWERRITDPDFLHVCVGVGRAPQATPVRMGGRNDPTVEYDGQAKAAAGRLLAAASSVSSEPAVLDLSRGGVVSVLRTDPRHRSWQAMMA